MSTPSPHQAEALKRVGELIRNARDEAGLTAAELGALVDPPVSIWRMCRLEQGKSPQVPYATISALGAVLGIDPDELNEPFAMTPAQRVAAS